MVKYALEKYNGDPTRVYVMGGSGGGMCTQALLAVYPEIFKAGHERAGVAAGCWAEQYDDGMQWSTPCATGAVNKTPEEWGNYVRDINPAFAGPRPRIQLNHGNADETINFKNLGESVEQWTNVLDLEEAPMSSDMGFQGTAKTSTTGPVTYNRRFWKDACGYTVMEAWEAIGQKHGMGYESEAILKWFGLDEKRDQDPWDAACGGANAPGGGVAGGNAAGGNAAGGSASGSGSSDEGSTSGSGDVTSVWESTGDEGSDATSPGAGETSSPSSTSVPGNTGANPAPATSVPAATSPAVTPAAVPVTPSPAVNPSTTNATATTAPGVTSGSPAAGASSGAEGGCNMTRGATNGGGASLVLLGLGLVLRRRRSR